MKNFINYFKREKRMNPVRNSCGASNPAGIILGPNPAAEQRGIISNGVKRPPAGLIGMFKEEFHR